MSQPQEGAVDFNTVESAAQEIERRMTEAETPTQEVIAEEQSAELNDDAETQDEQEQTEQEPAAEQDDEETELESESDEPEAESEDTFQSLADFAEALEMPMDEFMASIKTTVKINGEEQEVNLNDLKNGYQMESDYRRKTTELAEQRKSFEQERTTQTEQLQNSLSQVNAMLTNAEQELLNEYNSVNWDEYDDVEQLKLERSYEKRAQRLEAQKQQAAQSAYELTQQQQAEQQAQLQQVIQKEAELLLDAIPEWNVDETRTAEQQQIISFAQEYGFSEAELSQVADHRVIKLMRDAMKTKGMGQKVDTAKKKVKTLPKVVKPGAKQTKQELAAQTKSKAADRFKKTGDRNDLVTALIDRM